MAEASISTADSLSANGGSLYLVISIDKSLPNKAFDDLLRDHYTHKVEILPNLMSCRSFRAGGREDIPVAKKVTHPIQCEGGCGLGYVDRNEAMASYSMPIVTSRIQVTNNYPDLGVVQAGVHDNTADNSNPSQTISNIQSVTNLVK